MNHKMKGKYRARTWLREHLPLSLAERIPPGPRDCGNHDWTRYDEDTWVCIHCKVGVSHSPPWPPATWVEKTAAALRGMLEEPGASGRPLKPYEEIAVERLTSELDQGSIALAREVSDRVSPEIRAQKIARLSGEIIKSAGGEVGIAVEGPTPPSGYYRVQALQIIEAFGGMRPDGDELAQAFRRAADLVEEGERS
jgi:hypothetical protein